MSEESVVPVASKNINSGEMPTARTVVTFNAKGPVVPVQPAAAEGAVTVIVVPALAEPPEPVQVIV